MCADPQLRLRISRALSNAQYSLLVADTLAKGLAMLAQSPSLVIIDESIDGGPLEAMFEVHAKAPGIPVVAVLESGEDRGLVGLGARAVVPRVIVRSELVPVIQSILEPAAARPISVDVPMLAAVEASPPAPEHIPDSLYATLRTYLSELTADDPFSALKLDLDADSDDVRRAYLDLAKEWHPCRYGLDSPEVREVVGDIFIVIKRAHDAIIDPQRRAACAEQIRNERAQKKARRSR